MDTLQLSHDRNIYTTNPYNYRGLSGFFREIFQYDQSDWIDPIKNTLSYYEDLLIENNGNLFLPKGTLLYHGSLHYPFKEGSQSSDDPTKITFFGLDATISIWYVLELIEMLIYKLYNKSDIETELYNRYGYLYVFKLTDDLPVHHILKTLFENPKEHRNCIRRNTVCLHPQVNFRGMNKRPDIYELSSEVTFHYSDFKNSLELIDTYLVDPLILFQNKYNTHYDPRESVIKIDEYQSEYNQKLPYKKYKEYYLDDKSPSNMTKGGKKKKRTFKKRKKSKIDLHSNR